MAKRPHDPSQIAQAKPNRTIHPKARMNPNGNRRSAYAERLNMLGWRRKHRTGPLTYSRLRGRRRAPGEAHRGRDNLAARARGVDAPRGRAHQAGPRALKRRNGAPGTVALSR